MGTKGDGKAAIRAEMKQTFGQVPSWIDEMPESIAAPFWAVMRDFQLGETRIPNKYKELIGLAVSGATRCRYCALFHTEAARLFGATDEEIAEASAMGAHTMFASTFLNAQQIDYQTFRRETLEMVDYVKQQMASKATGANVATQQRAGGDTTAGGDRASIH